MIDRLYLSTIDPMAGDVARRYGLGVEIASFCTAWNMDEHLSETDEVLKTTLAGISRRVLHGPFNELFPCAIDPNAEELARYRYRQAIGLAQRYGASKVVFHGAYVPRLYFPQWYEERSIHFWRDFLPEIPEEMTVCLENVLEPEPRMLASIVQAVDDKRIRLCLDVGHANAYSRIPVLEWLEESAGFLSHLHIHNNDSTGDSHSPLFEGSIPVKELFNRVVALCPEATLTLELPDSRSSVRWLLEEKHGKQTERNSAVGNAPE